MRLFIAEKPSMGAEIAKVLGSAQRENGYFKIGNDVVTWAFGHILKQLDPDEYDPKYKIWKADDLPIFPEWKLKVVQDCKAQFTIIKKLIGEADEIVNAGDPDREGQLLIDEILTHVKTSKPVQRLLLNALDEKSIRAALGDLRDNRDFIGLKNSAMGRSRADWLVGINLTRAYTLAARRAGHSDVLQIGRVKTPTMALVVRREEEIQTFKPVTHYQLKVNWLYDNAVISSLWQPDETIALDPENRLLDRFVAESTLRKIKTISGYKSAAVSKLEKKEKKEAQRLPYSLSALQIEAGKRYGYDPQLVLNTMQQLYEKKLTTYPRSDCDFLPENQFSAAAQILKNLQENVSVEEFPILVQKADLSIKSRCWNDKKISAHHAIIPTSVPCKFAELTDEQQCLYYMVSQAYLAQFYPVHVYESTKLWIECADEVFTATGKMIKELGWKGIYPHKNKEEGEEDSAALPDIYEGETVKYQEGEILEKITTPPKRFTTASLLQAMKEIHKYVKDPDMKMQLKSVSGIGTEATRAGIIDELTKKGFLLVEKKQLHPTDKAKMMVQFLPDSLTYPDTTAIWEEQLEQVEKQELSLTAFCEKQKSIIVTLMSTATNLQIEAASDAVSCPICGGYLQRRKWKNGFFWGCMNYPDCTSAFPDEKGKPGIHLCPVCKKGYLRKLKGKKGDFWSCNAYPNCKTTFNDKNGKPDMNEGK